MTDRRLLPSNGRVAHTSLRGVVAAEEFVDGSSRTITSSLATLADGPDGPRERELRFGDRFLCLEERAGFVFGVSEKDGYVGTITAGSLAGMPAPTHVVATRATHALTEPDVKARGALFALSLGSWVHVIESGADWSRIAMPDGASRFVPSRHLRPRAKAAMDPVAVARLCLGVPYVWGGNSSFGIDCSGIVQLGYHMAGLACPADSDQQEAMPGTRLADIDALASGDLVFWSGHVAMATDDGTLVHANAHHMQVVEEPTGTAMRRIGSSDTGGVTSMLRPERRPLAEGWPVG